MAASFNTIEGTFISGVASSQMAINTTNVLAAAGLNINYKGTSHGLIVRRTENAPSNGNVLLVTSDDLGSDASPMDTTIGVTGYELGKGTVKINHVKPVASTSGSDANASVLSLRANGTGTAAQGIFFDAEDGGTTGDLLNFKNAGSSRLVLNSAGQLQLPVQGSTGGLFVGGDCNFFRSAANTWRSDDQLQLVAATAGTVTYVSTVSGSSPANYAMYADGKQEWGSGSATRDVTYARTAANTMTLTGNIVVTGTITHASAVSATPAAITVTASPFTYQNTNGGPISVSLSGGSVSKTEWSTDNTNWYDVGAQQKVDLQPTEYVRVTYSTAPTMTKVPRR